jgi:hypothetical protein
MKSDLPLTEKTFDMLCECGAELAISGGNTFVYLCWYAPPKHSHLRLVKPS